MGLRIVAKRIQTALGSPVTGQVIRFIITGGLVALVYIATTSLLAEVLGIPFEAALAIGFVVAIATHFTLQRLFVWAHDDGYALQLRHQVMRYLLVAGAQYGTTALATATLPHALDVSTEVVYVTTAVLLAAVNFLVFRSSVFHPGERAPSGQLSVAHTRWIHSDPPPSG
jgi:putative flippase GtrA